MSQISKPSANTSRVDSPTRKSGGCNEKALKPKTINRIFDLTKCLSGIRDFFFSAFQRPSQVSTDLMDVSFLKETWRNRLDLVPEKKGLNSLLMFLLSFCLPVCCPLAEIGSGGSVSCGIPKTVTICLPARRVCEDPPPKKVEAKPVGMVTQHKDMELNNSKLVFGCNCGKRNGLSGMDCPRSCCRNNPGCTMVPPQCWPQFKEPEEPPTLPDQKLMILPVHLIYFDSPCN